MESFSVCEQFCLAFICALLTVLSGLVGWLFARLGRIEIQSRSSLYRGHYLVRFRSRRANFCVSWVSKTLFPYTKDTLNVSDEPRYSLGVGIADTYFLYRDQPWLFVFLSAAVDSTVRVVLRETAAVRDGFMIESRSSMHRCNSMQTLTLHYCNKQREWRPGYAPL